MQWDTSVHDWLEGRGPQLYLVAMIDDATSRAYGHFVEPDSTEANLRVLWGYLERWGRPVEFYTDKSSLFTVNRPRVEAADEAVKEEWTQIGRALRELGIGWIAAHSPQAKGRIERFFGTAQDRLVKGLRLAEGQQPGSGAGLPGAGVLAAVEPEFHGGAGGQHRRASTAARRASTGGDPQSCGRTVRDLRLYDPLPGEDLSDCAQRYPPGTAGRPGASGATAGREHGGEVSAVRPEREGVPSSTENALTPETGERAEAATQGCAQLDEGFQSAQESTVGCDSGSGKIGPQKPGRVATFFGGSPPSPSGLLPFAAKKRKAELSTLLRLGTFYFALTG